MLRKRLNMEFELAHVMSNFEISLIKTKKQKVRLFWTVIHFSFLSLLGPSTCSSWMLVLLLASPSQKDSIPKSSDSLSWRWGDAFVFSKCNDSCSSSFWACGRSLLPSERRITGVYDWILCVHTKPTVQTCSSEVLERVKSGFSYE